MRDAATAMTAFSDVSRYREFRIKLILTEDFHIFIVCVRSGSGGIGGRAHVEAGVLGAE